MNITRYLLVLSALFSAGFGATPPVDSSITAVTVYTDRAIVTRSATVELATGPAEIVFDRLPVGLLDQSIRASGRGVAGATILDVRVGNSYVDFVPNERVGAIQEQLRGLQDETRKLDDRAATLGKQRDFIERMVSASTTLSTPAGTGASRPSLEEWEKLYAYSEQAFDKLAAGSREIDTQRAAIALKKAALDKQLGELRGAGSRAYKTVTVRLNAATPGNLSLSLAYSVPGASWTPAYDARLKTDERAIDLTYFGVVRQNTGEDWKDVAMTLSTARPALGGGAPEPRPWIIDVQERLELARKKSSIEAAATSMAAPALRQAQEQSRVNDAYAAQSFDFGRGPNAALAMASMDSGLTSATFRVGTPISLASDNNAQKFAVTGARLAAAIQYQSTPKLLEAAFLVVSTMNRTDFPFLAGTLNTFLDDTFVAASTLRTVMPGEKFDLPFGADDGISIKRKLVSRFSEETGITSHGEKVTYDVLITITNNKKTAEKLTFRESLPVSHDEKVVVRSIAPAERDIGTADRPKEVTRDVDGILAWKIVLQPGEKREIAVKVSVEHPADLVVAGLE